MAFPIIDVWANPVLPLDVRRPSFFPYRLSVVARGIFPLRTITLRVSQNNCLNVDL